MATFRYPQTQTTITGGATEAKQDDIIAQLVDVNTELDSQTVLLTSLDGKDFATETTLTALNAKVTAVDTTGKATEAKQDDIITQVTAINSNTSDVSTETTLSALNAKVTAVDTGNVTVSSSVLPTGASTSANQTTANASLSNIEADIDALNARLAGNLVPETFDYVAVTYVAAGNGTGEIETVTYRTGGAAGSVVATLTLAYDGSDRLSTVTRT